MATRAETRAATRRAVTDAAWALFADQGYDATTVRQVAKRAGVSVGTVVNAGGTASLLLDLVQAAIAERMDTADPTGPDPTGPDPATAIWTRFAPYFDYFAGMPDLARAYGRLLFTGAGRHHQALTTQADVFTGLIAGDITSRIPTVTAADAGQAAAAIFACYIRALATWGSGAVGVDEAVAVFRGQLAWQMARFDTPSSPAPESGQLP